MRFRTLDCMFSWLLYLIFVTFTGRATSLSSDTWEQSAPLPKPSPKEIYLCHKPFFYDQFYCGFNTDSKDIANFIMLDVSKLTLNVDQWIHIDILPTVSASYANNTLKIIYAMIQLTDTRNRVIGHIAEQIPCEDTEHPQYFEGLGTMSQLYKKPGVNNIKVIECPITEELNYNFPPTVGMFSFINVSVEAFYVNIGFTKEEAEFIKNRQKSDRIFITTLLVDSMGKCYLHRVEQLDGVPHKDTHDAPEITIPVNCHDAEYAFQTETLVQTPLLMDKPANWSNVKFLNDDLGERPRRRIPPVSNPIWQHKILLYNLKNYGLDGEGLTQLERKEDTKKKKSTGLGRNVPVIMLDTVEEEQPIMQKSFDHDDEECDDKLRTKKPNDVKYEIGRIYFGCKHDRQCIGIPDKKCLEEKNCDFVASWGKEGDYIVFGVLAHMVTYAAVGVSLDAKMGDDSVTECNREPNGLVYGYTSWNYRENGISGNIRLRSCESMKDFIAERVGEESIFCSWKRPIKTNVKGITFDLNNAHYILTATGHTTSNGIFGNIEKHELSNLAVRQSEITNKYVGKSPFQYLIVRIHGTLMIVVWMFIVPVATFASRYLKATFVTRSIRNFSFWFGLHLILVIIATISTIICTIVVVTFNEYERAKDDGRSNAHSMLGICICALIFVQVGLAIMIMNDHRQKFSLKFYHGMVGHVTTLCSYACIFTSRNLKDGFPCDTIISYSLYLALYLILHLFMSYLICYSDFVRGRKISRVYQIFIIDHDKNHDQPRIKHPSKALTIQAEASRRRRKNLDDFDFETIEEGTIIDPDSEETADEANFEQRKEEPGAAMRKVIFVLFLIILGSFTFGYLIMIQLPKYFPDCQSRDIMEPGVMYKPGYLY